MKYNFYLLFINLLVFLFIGSSLIFAQDLDSEKKETGVIAYQLRAGINFGGFTPIPIPAEIRELSSFNPMLNISLEGSITYLFKQTPSSWGIRTGIKLENKGMKANSIVKNYRMEIIGGEGERVAGNWTGGVSTHIANSYITIPTLAIFKVNDRWSFSGGAFWSFLMDKNFSGYVFDGYLREGDPTGVKVIFEDGKTASYDFSNDLRQFSYGLQFGSTWQFSKHINVFGDLSFGLNNMFKSDFKTITFTMRPVYLNFGAGYSF
ncbi:PorT family protein [Chryseobacterium sp. Ch-15]|uniref:PorT family protein n=1 Tax=Chryseobacterium muglaense TaxID=2893752 RepID=A0A9Q3YR50_9FLAO|nr:porin family protein [Chryseobacterium muglaense]MBD3906171.1 PorT family protein [Chryseobacterium muglaense]MCC9033788.1 PorT family protein [Chryseobacterium muglaense]MCM2555904.1 PorT family protein [Chryseobacterium muglaense]